MFVGEQASFHLRLESSRHAHQAIAVGWAASGLQVVDKGNDFAEEQLVLEFAEGTRLYVPIAKVDLVQKYVGGGRANPLAAGIWLEIGRAHV